MTPRLVEPHFVHPGWHLAGCGAIRGTPFAGSVPLGRDDAIQQAVEALEQRRLAELVRGWNGFFAVVAWSNDRVGLAADRARSIPLFYSSESRDLKVSDGADWIRERLGNPALDPVRIAEFLLAGYVLNDATLCPGVRQVQSGEAVETHRDEANGGWTFTATRYRVFKPAGTSTVSYSDQLSEYGEVLTRCFDRAMSVAGNRQIVVPLSGGYDSRLLLLMLLRHGVRNLVAYTYGADASEVERSRIVAESAGVPWHHCDYLGASWHSAGQSAAFGDYLRNASTLTSVGCIQEWLAVSQLRGSGAIHPDAVFMPGYAADLPAGSFLTALGDEGRKALNSRAAFERLLWSCRLANWAARRVPAGDREAMQVSVARSVEATGWEYGWVSAYDTWMFMEQVPKFTVNALRAVDLQGHDWWLPFFDDEFLAFWERVPDEYRLGERLHCDFTDDLFRRVTGAEPPARERKAKYGTVDGSPGVGGVKGLARKAVRALYHSPMAGRLRRRRQEALWARDYKDNPMGWLALFPESQYLDMAARGVAGINGMLAETYLGMLGAIAPRASRGRLTDSGGASAEANSC